MSLRTPLYSVTRFDFSADTLSVYRKYTPLDMSYSSIATCNEYGQLAFYTNLLQVNDTNDVAIPNGTGLDPGEIADESLEANLAYRSIKGAMILPKPNNDSIYYLLHVAWEYDDTLPQNGVENYFYYTEINMSANNGMGAVMDKNHVLVNDFIMGEGGFAACKHANGRDWWIFVPKLFSNCYYQFLLTPEGIETLGLQCVGDSFNTRTKLLCTRWKQVYLVYPL
jgi:hypothetical protein